VIAHLPILQVVVPLLSAPVCVVLRRHNPVWVLVFLASWTAFFIAVLLLNAVSRAGEIHYVLGGWDPPWGIEYRLDVLSAYLLLIVTAIGAVVISFARESVIREISSDRIYLFYTAYLLNLAGLLGVITTGDVFNMFVFIEISSLSSYALISLGRDRLALLAAYRYLVLGTIGATFFLIGVGLLYVMTGTLNIVDLRARLTDVEHTRTIVTALAFLTVGISLKFALFPLHFWLPGAYTFAPSVVSVFLASTTTKVYIYVMLRFLYSVFNPAFVFDVISLDLVFLVCALLAIFSGSLNAIRQNDVKCMMAYSSIAQIGYMILGVSLVSVTGLLAGIIHLFNHALMKGALFMCLACVYYKTGSVRLGDLRGIGRRMPWTMAAFVVAGLSLVGIPLTVGFISKWYLVLAAIERDWWWLVAAVIAGSLLAVVYIWRVVETAYFRDSDDAKSPARAEVAEAPLSMLIPLWAMIAANLYFGIDTSLTIGLAEQAANYLLGAGP